MRNENKRFKLHIEWYNKEKTDGEATLNEMGQPLGVIESIEDARLIRNILNELSDENEELKKENEDLKAIKEFWKGECLSNSSLNQILRNELDIVQEKGYEPTNSFKQYIIGLAKENRENE